MKKQKFTYNPFHFPGRIQVIRSWIQLGIGLSWNVSKHSLRKGFTIHLPFYAISFYFNSLKRAQEIYYINNPN